MIFNIDGFRLEEVAGKTVLDVEHETKPGFSGSGGEEVLIRLSGGKEVLIYQNHEGQIVVETD